jgi:ubiquitin C-terminal hydrolase
MNAVVQAMASLEEFVKLLESEDWLLKVIRKQLGLSQVSQIEKAIEEWKQEETNKSHLILTRCLQNLFKQLIQGSEHPINPESLKSIMGKKNSIFATHFQQDAHEFLLNLVNEYEKECLFMVQGVLQKLQHFQVPCTITTTSSTHHSSKSISSKIASQTATKPEGLLKYFASVSAPKESSTESPSGKSLVSQLLPARTFRTDVYRSLTCESCGYSRRQVETFYDFSVDLPFYSESQLNRNRSPVEPNISPTPVNKANASSIQCYCEFEAVLSGMEGESTTSAYYHCPKNACSFRLEKSKLEEKKNKDAEAANEFDETSKDTNQEKVVLKQDQQQHQQPQSIKSYFGSASTHPSNDTCTSSSSFSFPSVKLEDLIKKQFEPVRLELKCEKCSEGKQALAAYEVDSIPSVLVLHLKRFEMNPHTGTFHKRCDPVHIPLTLDPVQLINEQNNKEEATISTKTISTPIEKDVYELKSIVHHMGKNIDEGHYVTDLLYPLYPEKENTNKKNILWKRRNDSVETLISQELALQGKSMQSCYILLYVKKKKPNQMQKELHLCRMAVENIKKKSPLTHSKTQKTIQEEENVSIQNDHILQIH